MTWDRHVLISANLSPSQFRQPDLSQQIADVLGRTGLPAARLTLEVTKGLTLDEADHVVTTMRELREQGLRVVLDDFGTVHAGMNHLRRFPFDGVKIDASFVHGLGEDDTAQAIMRAVLSICERLNLTAVAKGVETEPELSTLRALGCRFFQGYFAGRSWESEAMVPAPVRPANMGTVW
jgi:EAL domain-containing protein (putative c-di-GMP-specific phosphodiesterase class I)